MPVPGCAAVKGRATWAAAEMPGKRRSITDMLLPGASLTSCFAAPAALPFLAPPAAAAPPPPAPFTVRS